MRPPSGLRTLLFVVVLCLLSALTLAVLATGLRERQTRAKELDQAKQMLQAARLFTPAGTFEMTDSSGLRVPAQYDHDLEMLVPASNPSAATQEQIYSVFKSRLRPYLTNGSGEVTTFAAEHINLEEYINENRVAGYADLPLKLFYTLLPNYSGKENPTAQGVTVEGYVIPIAGFGLWGPIYGYLALESNTDTVIGVTWSAPMETPGLGAIIQEPKWQQQFQGKVVFAPSPDGSTNFVRSALGLTVVKGRVADLYGDTPRSRTAVDGITGATLTCNGVTSAFQKSLGPYRPLLNRVRDGFPEGRGNGD